MPGRHDGAPWSPGGAGSGALGLTASRGTIGRGGSVLASERHARVRAHLQRWPLDPVLEHPALEGVTRDAQQLGGLRDAAGARERALAQQALGLAEVEVFQEDRHHPPIGESDLVRKP